MNQSYNPDHYIWEHGQEYDPDDFEEFTCPVCEETYLSEDSEDGDPCDECTEAMAQKSYEKHLPLINEFIRD